jgi:hypothetical protein
MERTKTTKERLDELFELPLPDSVGECYDLIEELRSISIDRRLTLYHTYKTHVNNLIKHCNKLAGHTVYKPLL